MSATAIQNITATLKPIVDDLTIGGYQFYRTIVPELYHRKPVTWKSVPYQLVLYAPLLFLASLTRRPNTYPIRLLLLPSVILCIIISAYHYVWVQPNLNAYNWGQCLFAAVAIARALEFGLRPEGMLKINEIQPGILIAPNASTYKQPSTLPAKRPIGCTTRSPNHITDRHFISSLPLNSLRSKRKGGSPVKQRRGSHKNERDHERHSKGISSTFNLKNTLPLSPKHHSWLRKYVTSPLCDALEVLHTQRGIQWQFGLTIYIPPHTKPVDQRPLFLKKTFSTFVLNFFLLDLIEAVLKLFPGVGSINGGTMFYPNLPFVYRYTVSTIIHFLTGCCLLFGFNMVYELVTLFAVGVCDNSPKNWPPVMDHPFSSDSMHKFWAKHWHQLLRQTFYIFGGYPGKLIAGELGMLFGTFLASGLFHELAMLSMGRGSDHTVTVFFLLQGVILVLERLWRKTTGRRVRGFWGRVWVYFVVFILAQPLVNAWLRRGLGGSTVIPPLLSPTRLLLFPYIRKILL